MDQIILKKITLLNQTMLDSLTELDNLKIIEKFTEVGLKIFEADFGFAWWKTSTENEEYHLAYKSADLPYIPQLPRERGGNFEAMKNRTPIFVENVKKENYEKKYDVSPYMKSYVIIPITYNKYLYGNLILCYKQKHIFTEGDKELSISLGNITAQAITIRDFTQKEYDNLKRTEMFKYTWKLLQQEKIKTEFIANATHELRTPIAIIKGNVDLALKSGFKKIKPERALHSIDHEIKHLSQIISDLSILTSGAENLKDQIIFKEVNLKSLINHVAEKSKTISYKKKISIIVKKIPNITIWGDETYLEKMLTNLTKNSVTYGKIGGHTEISAKQSGKFIIINVTDNGIGIAKEDLPRIFERFYMADKSHGRHENTGLGLSIVKWVAEAHGGKVNVKSIKNKGSVFSVILPVNKV
ncbi:MAG: GAF domain-containing sensor histidine kinase [Candidatus Paceibacterota bacterium]|jgi:signal transduction histidine kinase